MKEGGVKLKSVAYATFCEHCAEKVELRKLMRFLIMLLRVKVI